ncbi:MFS transporter [Thiotrichales bacterium 19X7-9]|nr:MFS transporter [Thiotrichales bacterium 19X7-9]
MKYNKFITALIPGLFFFYTIYQLTSFNTLLPTISLSLSITDQKYSYIITSYLIGNAIMLIPGGVLLDRISIRKTFLFFIFTASSASLLLTLVNDYSIIVLSRFFAGTASAMSLLIVLKSSQKLYQEKSAFIIGLLISIGMSGGIVANLIYPIFLNYLHWQIAELYTAVFGYLLFIIALIKFNLSDLPNINDNSLSILSNFISILKKIDNIKIGIYIGLINLPIFLIAVSWGASILSSQYKISIQQASAITGLLFLGEIIGATVMGWLSDKIKSRKKIMTYGSILCIINIMLILQFSASLYFVSILIFSLGFLIACQVVGYPYIIENNKQEVSGLSSGFASLIVNLIGGLLQPVFIFIIHNSHDNLYDFNSAWLFILTSFLIAFFISISLKKNQI